MSQNPYLARDSPRRATEVQTPDNTSYTIQMIRKQFELDSEEDLLDDFWCTLKSKRIDHGSNSKMMFTGALNVTHHGRLYLTDENLCFSSNILGVSN